MSNDCFFAALAFEFRVWPLPQEYVVSSDSSNNIRFFIICLPDGSLRIRILRNGIQEDYETDIIVPEKTLKVVLSINYSPYHPNIRINGKDIESAPAEKRKKNLFTLNAQLTTPIEDIPIPDQHVPDNASDAEALFIRTVGDLSSASRSDDWYKLLKSSAPLRLLLLDNLLHKANERHRIDIQFLVAAPPIQPCPVDFDRIWHPISPRGLPMENTVYVGLKKFLKLIVFESKTYKITIKDIIRTAANADGGVHFGSAKMHQEALILDVDRETIRMGQTASRHILKNICEITAQGMTPLLNNIQGKPFGNAH